MRIGRTLLRVSHMAIDAGHALLLMDGIREVHADVLVAVHAQLRGIVVALATAKGLGDLKGSAVRVMAGGAVHTALIVSAALPFLPAEARIAVAASAQLRRAIHRHGALRMIGRHRAMAGLARHAILLPGAS